MEFKPEEVEELMKRLASTFEEIMPKYKILDDGSVYFFSKDEDKDAIREQTPPI